MRKEFKWIELIIAMLALLFWLKLPIFSFVLFVPLINIDGWTCATTINQYMYIPMGMTVLMMTAALIGHRHAMQITGIVQLIVCIIVLFSEKSILLSGNMGWISSLLRAIINRISGTVDIGLTQEQIDGALDTIRLAGNVAGHFIPENELNTIIYLLEKLGNLLGMKLTGESIVLMLDTIVSECIQMGIGFILHMSCTVLFVLISFLAPKARLVYYQPNTTYAHMMM